MPYLVTLSRDGFVHGNMQAYTHSSIIIRMNCYLSNVFKLKNEIRV